MVSQRSFIFAGQYAYSNLGCEAIVRGTANILRKEVGDCRFISSYFSEEICSDESKEIDPLVIHRRFPFLKRYSPSWIRYQLDRRYLHRPVSREVLSSLQSSLKEGEAVFMLGGDTFSPDYGNADVYFGLSDFVIDQGLPITIWGASIGPFKNNPDYERWAAERLRKVSLLCARETETFVYLQGMGLKDNVILTADPSFHMPPTPCELPEEIEKILNTGCIGLNLSPIIHRYIQREKSTTIEQSLDRWTAVAVNIVRAIQHQFAQPVLLIPHVFSECGDRDRDDYLFLKDVAGQLGENEGVYVLKRGLNAAQTKWVISRVRIFAGSRTHSTLAAISTGVPTICIGYSLKARGIAKDVYGHMDWLISGADLVKAPSFLCERLVSLSNQEDSIKAHLHRQIPIFQQRAQEAARCFLQIVG